MTAVHDSQLTNIKTAALAAGVEWPDELADALDAADATLTPVDRGALAGLVHKASTEGRDPATCPAVLDALTRVQLADAVPRKALADVAATARMDALRDHADEIVVRLRAVVADADQVLEDARRAVTGLDVFDKAQPSRLGPDQASRWVKGRDASLLVVKASMCRKLLGLALSATHPGRYETLLVADLDADQADRLGAKAGAAEVIRAGHRLDLADFDELGRRVAKVAEQRVQAVAQREQDWHESYVLHRGTGGPVHVA